MTLVSFKVETEWNLFGVNVSLKSISGLYQIFYSKSSAHKSARSELDSPPTTIMYLPSRQEAWYVLAEGNGEFSAN